MKTSRKHFKFTEFTVTEYNSKEELKKDTEFLALNKNGSIKCYTRYKTKNGKYVTEIYNI